MVNGDIATLEVCVADVEQRLVKFTTWKEERAASKILVEGLFLRQHLADSTPTVQLKTRGLFSSSRY